MKCIEDQTGAVPQSVFLNGKVLRKSLPVVRDTSTPHMPLLKRLQLGQGELAQFYDAEEGIRYISAIELREGGIRGNHYHGTKEERIYVVQGELDLIVEDMASRTRATVRLCAGDLGIIKTGVAHALKTVQPGLAVEFSPTRYDAADVHRCPL